MPMPSQADLDAMWRPAMALILASAVIMGSPGPSTISATAVAASYGLRRSLGYAGGLVAGTVAVLLGVEAGVAAVLLAIPHGGSVLSAVSAVYILWLAYRVATAPPLAGPHDAVAAPAFTGGFVLALANPKAWLAIAAVVSGTRLLDDDPALDALAKTLLLGAMIVVIHLGWLLAGASLSRVLRDPRGSRIMNLVLAAALAVTPFIALLH